MSSAVFSLILSNLEPGRVYYTDGDELIIEEYAGCSHKYSCGREYERYIEPTYFPYLLLTADANECTIGVSNGEIIDILWSETSFVPKKHDMGGQSKNRFQRGREEALKHWLRKVVEKANELVGDRQIIMGGPGITREWLLKEFPQHLTKKIVSCTGICYTDENGLWELLKKSRYT